MIGLEDKGNYRIVYDHWPWSSKGNIRCRRWPLGTGRGRAWYCGPGCLRGVSTLSRDGIGEQRPTCCHWLCRIRWWRSTSLKMWAARMLIFQRLQRFADAGMQILLFKLMSSENQVLNTQLSDVYTLTLNSRVLYMHGIKR